MPPAIACVNLKGGVGKTAIATNFAAYCGQRGIRTLLIDLDPQTNATFSCIEIETWREHAAAHGTVADLLGLRRGTSAEGTERRAADVLVAEVFENVDLIPSHLDLFTIDLDLASVPARERRLRRAVQPILDNYGIVICDCPPNLTIPTQNAIALCNHYVVPVSPDYLSGLGVGLLLSRIQELSADIEHEIEPAGIIVSRVGRPAIHREQTVAALRVQFGAQVLQQEITERVSVSSCAASQISIFEGNDNSAIAEFTAVGRELLTRIGVNP